MSRRYASTGESMGSRLICTPNARRKMRKRAKKEAEYAKKMSGPCHRYFLPKDKIEEMEKKRDRKNAVSCVKSFDV